MNKRTEEKIGGVFDAGMDLIGIGLVAICICVVAIIGITIYGIYKLF